jgi:hypothetical protein
MWTNELISDLENPNSPLPYIQWTTMMPSFFYLRARLPSRESVTALPVQGGKIS